MTQTPGLSPTGAPPQMGAMTGCPRPTTRTATGNATKAPTRTSTAEVPPTRHPQAGPDTELRLQADCHTNLTPPTSLGLSGSARQDRNQARPTLTNPTFTKTTWA